MNEKEKEERSLEQSWRIQESICVSLLRYCCRLRSLSHGARVHAHMARHSFRTTFLSNLLLQMYGSCGRPEAARVVFGGILRPSVLSWNLLIAAYAQGGLPLEALRLFRRMREQGLVPDRYTYLPALSACVVLGDLGEGRRIHQEIAGNALLSSDTVLQNALLHMYGKAGSLADACAVFDCMPARDLISWSSMISAYAHHGHTSDMLNTLEKMKLEGFAPDKITFLSLLNSCHTRNDLVAAHEFIAANQHDSDVTVMNALLHAYGKHGCLSKSRLIFDQMPIRDTISWNALITSYARNGFGKEAFNTFLWMLKEDAKPNQATFLSLLNDFSPAASSVDNIDALSLIWECIVTNGFELNTPVMTALLSSYGRCGRLKESRTIFDGMWKKGVISWNAMLVVYVENGYSKEALDLFQQMKMEGGVRPDRVTFLCLLNTCARLTCLKYGRAIHECIIAHGYESDVAVRNALLNMYGKCGSPKNAQAVFDGMDEKNVISWSAMISAYANNGHQKEALELFRCMSSEGVKLDNVTFLCLLNAFDRPSSLEDGRAVHKCITTSGLEPDISLMTALITMYGKCGSIEEARSIFDRLEERNLVSWSAMLAVYAQNGYGKEALDLFEEMNKEGLKPDKVAFLSLLDACAGLASLEKGREIHKSIQASGLESEVFLTTALINMYGKCGSVEEAWFVFNRMSQRTSVSWSTIIVAYTQNGYYEEALEVFQQMDIEGVKLEKPTFLSLLNACAGLASLENGRAMHQCVIANGLDSDVAMKNALLDMYGKCGSLQEAWCIFDEMHPKEVISCNAMLTAYARHGHSKETLELFQRLALQGLKPDKITLLCLLNACSNAGLLEEGWLCFILISVGYGITPSQEHYACVLDLLGRSGCLKEAEAMLKNMPVQIDAVSWSTLLSSAYSDVEQEGKREPLVQTAICSHGYRNRYQGVYPVKCNQDKHIVESVVEFGKPHAFGLEAGSKPELLLAMATLTKGSNEAFLVCNGYKDMEYIGLALVARTLAFNCVIVLEQEEELETVIEVSRRFGVQPVLGLRAKLNTKHSGHFGETSGERGKFGLTASEIVRVVHRLNSVGMLSCLQMLHFHIGSQIPSLSVLRDGVVEAAHIYCELALLGAHMGILDIGGGLGIDYDGSNSSSSDMSVGYGMDEFADQVVLTLKEVCLSKNIEEPILCSESGRALVSHHSVFIFESFSSGGKNHSKIADIGIPLEIDGLPEDLMLICKCLAVCAREQDYKSAAEHAKLLKETSADKFKQGRLSLVQLATINNLYDLVSTLANKAAAVSSDSTEVQVYHVNMSVFKSIPDTWAIGQLFPIMPIHRLHEKPTVKAVLSDLTCDSDGRISTFIGTDAEGRRLPYLPAHPLVKGQPYYMGMFLGGAYQEALGGMHNLFGNPDIVHVRGDGELYLGIGGQSAAEVLMAMHYDPLSMLACLRSRILSRMQTKAFPMTEDGDFYSEKEEVMELPSAMETFKGLTLGFTSRTYLCNDLATSKPMKYTLEKAFCCI